MLSAISAGVGIGSSIFGFRKNRKAEKNARMEAQVMMEFAKNQATRNKERIRVNTAEEAYRMSLMQEETMAAAVARAAASGVELSGSIKMHLDSQKTKMDRDMDWLYQQSQTAIDDQDYEAQMAVLSGNVSIMSAKNQSRINFQTGLTQLGSSLYDFGKATGVDKKISGWFGNDSKGT